MWSSGESWSWQPIAQRLSCPDGGRNARLWPGVASPILVSGLHFGGLHRSSFSSSPFFNNTGVVMGFYSQVWLSSPVHTEDRSDWAGPPWCGRESLCSSLPRPGRMHSSRFSSPRPHLFLARASLLGLFLTGKSAIPKQSPISPDMVHTYHTCHSSTYRHHIYHIYTQTT